MIFTDNFLLLVEDLIKNKPCIVSTFLKNLIKKKVELDRIDYISTEDDMITFVMKDKITLLYDKKVIKSKTFPNLNNFIAEKLKSKELYTVKMKIGRFIKTLSSSFTDKEIELFSNRAKANLKLRNDISKFEIVSGDNIRKYYYEANYQSQIGQLSKSCMRHHKCQNFLDLYVENPEICKLLILKGTDEKIVGRALLWETDDGTKYLDRVYSCLDSDSIFIQEYAKTLGYEIAYDKIFDISGDSNYKNLSISPKKHDFELYPFMDTFRIYYSDIGKFYIDEEPKLINKYLELDMTNGIVPGKAIQTSLFRPGPPINYRTDYPTPF